MKWRVMKCENETHLGAGQCIRVPFLDFLVASRGREEIPLVLGLEVWIDLACFVTMSLHVELFLRLRCEPKLISVDARMVLRLALSILRNTNPRAPLLHGGQLGRS